MDAGVASGLLHTAAITVNAGSFFVAEPSPRAKGQPPQGVAAARGHLRRCRSSTMHTHRLRRGVWHLAPRRSQRRTTPFFSSLLGAVERLNRRLKQSPAP